ncbi:unnamed protein product [Cylicocyclus nassatus]|uniref:Uncharacterized protein n=1 Tax=Cylicocyclus nassatus TaxID=53992 RepID=A0AA36GGB1_CYLNA|nr:unnamed protein product [Cylicocyclus nassatus]
MPIKEATTSANRNNTFTTWNRNVCAVLHFFELHGAGHAGDAIRGPTPALATGFSHYIHRRA